MTFEIYQNIISLEASLSESARPAGINDQWLRQVQELLAAKNVKTFLHRVTEPRHSKKNQNFKTPIERKRNIELHRH